MSGPLLPFCELELTHAIGVGEGRYLLGAEEDGPADVLQLRVVGAPAPREGRVLRRNRPVEDGDGPRELPVLRIMWIGASQPMASKRDAEDRLERLRREEDEREELVAAVLEVVNLAVRAHRAAARDPYTAELTREDPRELRLGYGSASELANGRWSAAFRPPPPRSPRVSRAERLGPTDVVVAALRGRLGLLEAEELALRALADVEQDRPRAAALELRSCVELLAAELREAAGAREEVAGWAETVAGLVPRAQVLATRALEGRPAADAADEVLAILDSVEHVLGAWRAPAAQSAAAVAPTAPPG
ncbi:hypothetical protein [Conexibacter sp. SYSU D00693]|uniref:hypothetical protein n=1 Tax=Conexibacter sp. SYSU D00693 TaxID=2812560 RepID=UPI00196B3FBF|nr:hypothetical protein [Conexibacter sp. SYSU D00693]